jgi:transcriptional regulator with XRE-family HTH domain
MPHPVRSKVLIDFGNNLYRFRIDKGMTQQQLAAKAHLHRSYIADIERGTRNVSIVSIAKIAKGLNVSMSRLAKGL